MKNNPRFLLMLWNVSPKNCLYVLVLAVKVLQNLSVLELILLIGYFISEFFLKGSFYKTCCEKSYSKLDLNALALWSKRAKLRASGELPSLFWILILFACLFHLHVPSMTVITQTLYPPSSYCIVSSFLLQKLQDLLQDTYFTNVRQIISVS